MAQCQKIAENLDDAIATRSQLFVFRTASGNRPANLNSTFDRLMLDSKLERDVTTDRRRTLYSLRHTYATLALMDGQMDMHTLAKQMGTSIVVLTL